MLSHTIFATVLAASASLVAALPAKSPQEIAVAPAIAPAALLYTKISTDGSCGGETGYTCEGSAFGNCCSVYGYCGPTEAFCGANCFAGAGLCDSANKKISKTTAESAKEKTGDSKKKDKAAKDSKVKAAAGNEKIIPEPTVKIDTTPEPVHLPWRPTPFQERPLKTSYIIDNGERAPNQVWN